MIDIQTAFINLNKGYKKNILEVRALIKREYPSFIFDSGLKSLRNEIPVFTFHSVEPISFENQLRYLTKNKYQTLIADDVYDCLIGRKTIPERSLCITFDDGWASVWTVAYPLLKKYGFKAVCFLVPGLVNEAQQHYPNLNDVADGNATIADISAREVSYEPLCTWEEIRKMHENGTIDFQSHSMYHSLIFTSPKVVDFINPAYDFHKKNFNVPVMRFAGCDRVSRKVDWGTPIYEFDTRFSGQKRYFDDADLRNACTEYVASRGSLKFFKEFNWRKRLQALVQRHRNPHSEEVRFEREEELRESILEDLIHSKIAIEKNLPHKVVRHFCYPWWVGSPLATELSKKAGYRTNFLGIIPERRTRNRRGDDPFRIGRLLSEDYIFRLPGEGRKSFSALLHAKGKAGLKSLISKLCQPSLDRGRSIPS